MRKYGLFLGMFFSLFAFSWGWAQTQPAASKPSSPAASTPGSIPIVNVGNHVKPLPSEKPKKTAVPSQTTKPATEKPKSVATKPQTTKPQKREEKKIKVETKKLLHPREAEIGKEVFFVVTEETPQIPEGAWIKGKITEVKKMEKNEPGKMTILLESISFLELTLPLSGTVEVIREKDKDSLGGKDIFILVGSQVEILVPKNLYLKKGSAKKIKRSKGLLTASINLENGNLVFKWGSFKKYFWKMQVYLEAPSGLTLEDIQTDSLRLIKINNYVLPQPLSPLEDKIKVADHDKNKVQELLYKFDGWELVQYLPEGESTLLFVASTKDGKPIEAIAKIKMEIR